MVRGQAGQVRSEEQRGLHRTCRMEALRSAAMGDYSPWLPDYRPDVAFNPIGDYIDDVRAVMMASHPGEGLEAAVRRRLRRAIGTGTWNLIVYGRTVFVGSAGTVMAVDMRYAWPFDDGESWAFVVPQVTGRSGYGTGWPDVVDVWIASGNVLGGYRQRLVSEQTLSTYGQLGEIIETFPAAAMGVSYCDRPPVLDGWGKPHTETLTPIAVAIARRESGADYAIDRNEVPKLQVKIANADAGMGLPGSPSLSRDRAGLTPDELRRELPGYTENDILVPLDGWGEASYVQAELNTEASLAFLDRLDRAWNRATGQMPMESGDSAAEESGVAFARKQVRLVARSRELHEGQYDALEELVGLFDWPYVGTMLGTMSDPANPAPDDPGLEDDPDA